MKSFLTLTAYTILKYLEKVTVWLGACAEGLTTPVILENGTIDANPGRTLRRPDTTAYGNVYYRFITFPTVNRRNLTFWHAPYYGHLSPCSKRLLTTLMWSDISVSDRL
ncbi:unnamed protein product [Rotaria magnacalcarata]